MTEIVLTAEQTAQLAGATDTVVITDAQGGVVAKLPPGKLSPEEAAIVAEAHRRLTGDSPRIPSAEVLAKLRRLDEHAAS